jgi:hypothetical protein
MSFATELVVTLEKPLAETTRCFNCPAYKQSFHYGQDMRIKYQKAEDRADYWCRQAHDYKAKYEYLQKLHFGKSTEKNILPKAKSSDDPSQNTEPKKHGAQKGHVGHGRNIPDHLPQKEQIHDIPADERHCDSCSNPFEDFSDEENFLRS